MGTPVYYKNEEQAVNIGNIWGDDLFGRKKLADNYTKLITSIKQPYVLSINGKYGSGKSFFLNRWAQELKRNNETVIFFNAWNCDFVEKPLLPFMHNFLEQLKEQKIVKYSLKNDIKNCKDVLCTTFKDFIDKTGGIDIEKLKEHTDANTIRIPKIQTLEEYVELQKVLDNFKKQLNNLVKKLKGKNLYIFIDELERCRPTFAVELLEAVKHLFNVSGLVFILGIDRSQLKHTISNIYGSGMDGDGYLRRFIDLELELTQPDIKTFSKFLYKKFGIENQLPNTNGDWVIGYNMFDLYFNIFSELYNFQLRDVEQIYAKFNAIVKMIDEKILKIMPILALLMILKMKDIEFYNEFSLEKITKENIDRYLNEKIYSKIKSEANARNLNEFERICMSLQKVRYYEMAQETSDQNLKRLYNDLGSIQRYTQPFNIDRIKYLKDMISCVTISEY